MMAQCKFMSHSHKTDGMTYVDRDIHFGKKVHSMQERKSLKPGLNVIILE